MNQAELPLLRPPNPVGVSTDVVRAQRSAAAAITLACSASGLEDKEIYLALDIDAGYFSNIKKGKATLQADLLALFCRTVGNRIYADWLAYQVGCQLQEIETETQRQLRVVREELAELKRDRAVERKLMAELVSGRAA